MSDFNDSKARKDSSSWKKSNKHLSSNLLNLACDDSEGSDKFKSAKTLNRSTLSLHIAAYENSNESIDDSGSAAKLGGLANKWDKAKQIFTGSSTITQVVFSTVFKNFHI